MGMTSLSIVLTVFVLQLHYVAPNQTPVPDWLRLLVINYVARALCMRGVLSSYYTGAWHDVRTLPRPPGPPSLKYSSLSAQADVANSKSSNNLFHLNSLNNAIHTRKSARHLRGEVNPPSVAVASTTDECLRWHQSYITAATTTARATTGPGGPPEKQSHDISGHVKIVLSKHGSDVDHENIVNEWKLVALIIDRFLFVLFLTISGLATLGILVFKPLTKPSISE